MTASRVHALLPVHPGGDLVDGPAHVIGQLDQLIAFSKSGKVHGASVAEATCSPASTKSRQRPSQLPRFPGSSRSNRPGSSSYMSQSGRHPGGSRWRGPSRPCGPAARRSPGWHARSGGGADWARSGPAPPRRRRGRVPCAAELMAWTETCQPASFARPIVAVRSAGSQFMIVPEPLSRWIFRPWTRRRSSTAPGFAIGVPVAEELVVVVQGEVGVDAQRQGIVSGQRLELVEALRVDPLLGDRGPAAASTAASMASAGESTP